MNASCVGDGDGGIGRCIYPAARNPRGATTKTPHSVYGTADTTTQLVHDLIVQLARQGLSISLRSLQLWADLGRQLDPTALGFPASATPDLFDKLLVAQREVVATQRQFAQGFFATATATATADGR